MKSHTEWTQPISYLHTFTEAEMMGEKASKTSLPRDLQSKAISVQRNSVEQITKQFKNMSKIINWWKANSRLVKCKSCHTSLISFTDLVADSGDKAWHAFIWLIACLKKTSKSTTDKNVTFQWAATTNMWTSFFKSSRDRNKVTLLNSVHMDLGRVE